jgi:Ca-activated chloride channel family protein
LTLETRTGLFTTADVPVPLAGVSVVADIVNLCARVTVTQRFVNREATLIEAVYLFPLDEGAAVCGFEALIDGTLVVGESMEREAAFAKYDDAMQAGHGAYLLDEERPDVFQASVGNLPPGKEALLKIIYVSELLVQDGELRFVVPTTISPRYAPAVDRVGVGRSDDETLNPPREWHVPYGLNLTANLAISGAIARTESPSHPIAMAVAGGRTTVTLATDEVALDRDFVLTVAAGGLDTPCAWIEKDHTGATAVAVSYVPALPADSRPAEVIFVVDESGSMQGSSIEQVRNALQLCLRSMIPGCHFNIVSFGSNFEALFSESRVYDESTLAAAARFVSDMKANRGGTEILPALTSVLTQKTVPDLSRQVVVLTDGQVSNTDAVLELAKAHAKTARVFTFGIGAGASHHLVQGLARAGGGSAESIFPGERIESKVVRLFGRLLAPAFTDVSLDWGSLDVVAAPSTVPPLFANSRLVMYGFVKTLAPATLTLTGIGPKGKVQFDVALDPSQAVDGQTIGTLAARSRIRELEESPEWTGPRASRQGRTRTSAVTREIIDLAVRYNLVSRETSLVAIEKRETPLKDEMKLRRIPIALTAGWGGFRAPMGMLADTMAGFMRTAAHGAAGMAAESALTAQTRGVTPELTARSIGRPASSGVLGSLFSRWLRAETAASEGVAQPPDESMRRRVLRLASTQRADGSWQLSDELADVIGWPMAVLVGKLMDFGEDSPGSREAWATAMALAWLDRECHDMRDEWELIARKGHQWLDRFPGGGNTYRTAASKAFSEHG